MAFAFLAQVLGGIVNRSRKEISMSKFFSAIGRYLASRPLLVAFLTIGAADVARSAVLSALGLQA